MNKNIFKYGPPVNILTTQKTSRNSTYTTNVDNSVRNFINASVSTTINETVNQVITNNLSTVINNSSVFISSIEDHVEY